jgi:hypothetical protein
VGDLLGGLGVLNNEQKAIPLAIDAADGVLSELRDLGRTGGIAA